MGKIIIILLVINLAVAALLLFGESVLFQEINKPTPAVHFQMKQVSKTKEIRV